MWFINLIGIRGLIAGGAMLAVGFALAWQIQGMRISNLKSDIRTIQADVATYRDITQSNGETIVKLRDELSRARARCAQRVKVRDKVIRQIQYVDSLKAEGTLEAGGLRLKEAEDEVSSSDAILLELNGLFGSPTANKD